MVDIYPRSDERRGDLKDLLDVLVASVELDRQVLTITEYLGDEVGTGPCRAVFDEDADAVGIRGFDGGWEVNGVLRLVCDCLGARGRTHLIGPVRGVGVVPHTWHGGDGAGVDVEPRLMECMADFGHMARKVV